VCERNKLGLISTRTQRERREYRERDAPVMSSYVSRNPTVFTALPIPAPVAIPMRPLVRSKPEAPKARPSSTTELRKRRARVPVVSSGSE
jgi:hypothetical protein